MADGPQQTQLRRGTTAENDAFTGATAEVTVDTDTDTLRVHDNSTAGGFEQTSNTATQTLTNKTLTTPTIGSFVNAAHDHADAAGGGLITTLGTVGTGTWNADVITVTYGGSGRASATAYGVLCGGTTATGAHQSIASVGTSGQVLTSNGAGALPTFQTGGTGDVVGPGSATDSAIVLFDGTTGKLVKDSTYTITAAGAALIDDASADAQRTTLGVGTGDSPQFTAINLGHASDTTLTRSAAGVLAVEGEDVALKKRTINSQTGTTYTLVLGDAGDVVTMSNASANTLTIPTNASVAFPVGTQIDILMKGAGITTVTGDTGVTVNGVSAGGATIDAQYKAVTIFKDATDTWFMVGAHGTVA